MWRFYRLRSSAGGMPPKAVILYNTESRVIRSGFADQESGDISAILKFDRVAGGPETDGLDDPQPFNGVEAAYARMARRAGLDAVDITPVEGAAGHYHLVIPRFDRGDDGVLHQHTSGSRSQPRGRG